MGYTQKLGLLAQSVFQDSSLNVGIGAAPSGTYKLEVTGTAKVSSTLLLGGALSGTSATFSSSVTAGGTLIANTGTGATFRAVYDSTNIVEIGNYSVASGYQGLNIIGSPIKFYTGTAGAGSAALALTINTTGATFSSSVNLGGYLTGQGTNPGGLGGSRYVIDWLSGSMRIFSYGANASTNGGFVFNSQRSDGTNSFDPMTITSGGNVGIGGTDSIVRLNIVGAGATSATWALYMTNSTPTALFGVRNDGWLISPTTYNNTSGVAANLGIDSSGNIFKATSSIKYKKDIKPYDKGLDTVLLMNPIYYKSISDFDGDKQFAGFIAEEIEELGLKEFVQYNDETNEPAGLNYGNITAILVKAIQEQQATITELTEKVNRLYIHHYGE